MKRFFLAMSLFLYSFCYGQPSQLASPYLKNITVTGSAEMEIIPDQIYVNILLKEYQKKGENKKELDNIKADFLTACRAVGIADSLVSIVSYTGYNSYYAMHKKKKNAEMNASITYQVKFSTSKDMDALVDKLDDEATQSFSIVYTSHSKISEYRKQLKIEAIKAAKAKGIYLTEAIGEKLGAALTVKEPEDVAGNVPRYSNQPISQAVIEEAYMRSNTGSKDTEILFKKIKLRYEVVVIFTLL